MELALLRKDDMTARWIRSSGFLAISLLFAPGPADAAVAEETRESEDTRPAHTLCWRGHPLPECRAFIITEFGVYSRLDHDPTLASDSPLYFTLDVGPVWNRTRDAAGLTAYLATGSDHARVGARVRYRRWLSRHTSVDFAPGIIFYGSEDGGYTYKAPGLVAGLSLNAGDLFGVGLEMENSRYTAYSPTAPQVGSDTTWRAGAKLGSGLGVLGALALVGLAIVVVASTGG